MEKEKLSCHDCRFKYSCGYTGCLSGTYACCEEHLFKKAEGKFWSLAKQKEVNEKEARKDWGERIVKDKDGEND